MNGIVFCITIDFNCTQNYRRQPHRNCKNPTGAFIIAIQENQAFAQRLYEDKHAGLRPKTV